MALTQKRVLNTDCPYCARPLGQGDHSHCLNRLRHFKPDKPKDAAAVGRQLRWLTSAFFQRLAVKTCPKCGVTHRWRSKSCHAHTKAWKRAYGPEGKRIPQN